MSSKPSQKITLTPEQQGYAQALAVVLKKFLDKPPSEQEGLAQAAANERKRYYWLKEPLDEVGCDAESLLTTFLRRNQGESFGNIVKGTPYVGRFPATYQYDIMQRIIGILDKNLHTALEHGPYSVYYSKIVVAAFEILEKSGLWPPKTPAEPAKPSQKITLTPEQQDYAQALAVVLKEFLDKPLSPELKHDRESLLTVLLRRSQGERLKGIGGEEKSRFNIKKKEEGIWAIIKRLNEDLFTALNTDAIYKDYKVRQQIVVAAFEILEESGLWSPKPSARTEKPSPL